MTPNGGSKKSTDRRGTPDRRTSMPDNSGSDLKKKNQAVEKLEFDIDADIKRLKTSSRFLAVTLVLLAVAFLILLVLSLGGYFEIQQNVADIKIVNKLYPTMENLPVFKDPTEIADKVGNVGKSDTLYELQRLPGFVKIQTAALKGWVLLSNVKTKLEIKASDKGFENKSTTLEIGVNITSSKKDVVVNGKVINHLDAKIKNVRVVIDLLNDEMQTIYSQVTNLAPKENLGKGDFAPFAVVGQNYLDRTRFVACEVEDFDLVSSTIVIQGSDTGTGAGTEGAPGSEEQAPPPAPKQ
jgi:hypothetical protein